MSQVVLHLRDTVEVELTDEGLNIFQLLPVDTKNLFKLNGKTLRGELREIFIVFHYYIRDNVNVFESKFLTINTIGNKIGYYK